MQADEARELAWRLKYPGENRCAVCSFPLGKSPDNGCVIGNCSYRPHPGSAEDGRVSRHQAELAEAQGIIVAAVDALLARHALEARVALLRELAAEECPACKDGAELFRDEESGQWAHERSGLPNFLCEAPEIVAERIASLAERASKGAAK